MFFHSSPKVSLIARLWKHLTRRRKKQILALLCLMIITSITEVISIGAVLPFLSILVNPEDFFNSPASQTFIEIFQLKHPKDLLLPVTVIFVLAALGGAVARVTLLWFQTRLSTAIGADFSIQVYERTLYQPYSLHLSRNSSEILAGVEKANSLVPQVIQPILTIISSILMAIAVISTLFLIQPGIALSAFFCFGFIYLLIVSLTRRRIAENSKTIAIQQGRVTKAIQEGLGGIRDVLIDGTQSIYSRIYRNAFIPMRFAVGSNQVIGAIPRFGIEALGMVLIAGLAYLLFHRGEGADVSSTAIPILGALALGAQRLLPIFQQTYTAYIRIKGNYSSTQDAINLLDQPLPKFADNIGLSVFKFSSAITFKDIGFRYNSDNPWVFRNVNFKIPIGSRVGIVGMTGSGKSTLLDIAMGLLPPTEGSIHIDGLAIKDANTRLWQAKIAHVPQSIFLADTSIAENIAFGVALENIDLKRVQVAAEKAQIAEVINNWHEGYATLVGERGVRLSGGQRQRIGIARALYKQAKVIMLDEATSALDNETEAAIIETIENLGVEVTIIIIAHRLSTLKCCNQILELDGGNLQAIGGYDQMIARKNARNSI